MWQMVGPAAAEIRGEAAHAADGGGVLGDGDADSGCLVHHGDATYRPRCRPLADDKIKGLAPCGRGGSEPTRTPALGAVRGLLSLHSFPC